MASVKVLLYTSKVLKNGEHPIMLRLIKDRKIKYVSLDYSCSKELWDEDEQRPVKKHPHKVELNIKITKMMNDANKIILDFEAV
ncbi:Arm DNA-binding domain-containing protein [Rufibacter ruber]|uniref:Arm DNA-binding domain-containing protein n=1 Tax=Rufibacter ruber TaxID=1783499 RepID=UPI00082E00EC|nr:Arm DNA-binding domain-containing protein [Rufibacter ruber]